MRFLTTLACLVLLTALYGCGPGGPQKGPIGVVDVQYLMQQTGEDLAMQQVVQQRIMMLNQQLSSMRTDRNSKLQAKQSEFGSEPTDQQQAELQKMNTQFVQELQQAQMQADQNVNLIQQQFIMKFREKMAAIATDVAKERGFSMIVAQNENVLTFDSKLDVTDLFIERFKSLSSESPAADVPAAAPATNPLATPSVAAPPALNSPAAIPPASGNPGGVQFKLPGKSETPAKTETASDTDEQTTAEPKTQTEASAETSTVTEKATEATPTESPESDEN